MIVLFEKVLQEPEGQDRMINRNPPWEQYFIPNNRRNRFQQKGQLMKSNISLSVCVVCPCSLLEHCRRHRYLSQSGEELALLLSSLLENLLAYRTITHDESPEHRMSCTVNVLVRHSTSNTALCRRCSAKINVTLFPLAELLQREEEGGHLHPVSRAEARTL